MAPVRSRAQIAIRAITAWSATGVCVQVHFRDLDGGRLKVLEVRDVRLWVKAIVDARRPRVRRRSRESLRMEKPVDPSLVS